jgi:hypothetical protein
MVTTNAGHFSRQITPTPRDPDCVPLPLFSPTRPHHCWLYYNSAECFFFFFLYFPVHTIPLLLHSITMSHNVGTSTQSLHADDALNVVSDVAPPLHLSTTFRYSDDPSELFPAADLNSVCIVQ